MFWKRKPGMPHDYVYPTSFDKHMGFEKWLQKAYEADDQKLEAESEHLYFHKVRRDFQALYLCLIAWSDEALCLLCIEYMYHI